MAGTNNPNGRPAGVPNKRTKEFRELIEAYAAKTHGEFKHPGEVLYDIMVSDSVDIAFRLKASSELIAYLEAKRKSMELTGADGGPIQATTTVFKSVRPAKPEWGKVDAPAVNEDGSVNDVQGDDE